MHYVRLLALAAIAAVTLGIVLSSSGSAQQPGERTLTFIERSNLGTFNLIDNPPKSRGRGNNTRLSAGDMFVFRGPLFDANNTQRVGQLGGTCTAVKGGRFASAIFHCSAGMQLSDGTIEFQGPVTFGRTLRVAVVGGTQAYENARGSLTSTEGQRTSTDAVHLLP